MPSKNSPYFEEALHLSELDRSKAEKGAIGVYIATSLGNRGEAARVASMLESTGLIYITYKWWIVGPVPASAYSDVSYYEMRGVTSCDGFIGLLPGRLGMASELGAAIALNKKPILYAADPDMFNEYEGGHPNIFWHHPSVDRISGRDSCISLAEYFSLLTTKRLVLPINPPAPGPLLGDK